MYFQAGFLIAVMWLVLTLLKQMRCTVQAASHLAACGVAAVLVGCGAPSSRTSSHKNNVNSLSTR